MTLAAEDEGVAHQNGAPTQPRRSAQQTADKVSADPPGDRRRATKAAEIRSPFLNYFASKGHQVVASSPVASGRAAPPAAMKPRAC